MGCIVFWKKNAQTKQLNQSTTLKSNQNLVNNNNEADLKIECMLIDHTRNIFKIRSRATGEELKKYIYQQVSKNLSVEKMDLFHRGVKIQNQRQIRSYSLSQDIINKIQQRITQEDRIDIDDFDLDFDQIQNNQNTVAMTCGHRIERDCMAALIQNTINEKEYEIKCPYFKEGNFHCNCVWNLQICLKIAEFSSKECDQIRDIFTKNLMNELTVKCPNPDCQLVLSKEESVENVLICPQCMELIITSTQLLQEQNFDNFVYTNPLMQRFSLKNQDFNQNNNEYFGLKMKVEVRGGFPYYQPPKGKRYGLKVNGKYDNGDDKWLGVKGLDGEWAEAFHGINNPTAPYNGATVFNSIMSGMSTGKMLIAGSGQAYSDGDAVNKPNEKIGKGVYFSPHIQECLSGYCQSPVQISGVKYKVVLQCKINPKKVMICSKEIYWVLTNSEDIRPYGVILVREEDYNHYPTAMELFKEQFSWGKYKDQINDYLARQV